VLCDGLPYNRILLGEVWRMMDHLQEVELVGLGNIPTSWLGRATSKLRRATLKGTKLTIFSAEVYENLIYLELMCDHRWIEGNTRIFAPALESLTITGSWSEMELDRGTSPCPQTR
jgi:hypothetical protein